METSLYESTIIAKDGTRRISNYLILTLCENVAKMKKETEKDIYFAVGVTRGLNKLMEIVDKIRIKAQDDMQNNAKRLLTSSLQLPSLVIDNIVSHLMRSCKTRDDWLFEEYPNARKAVMRSLYRELCLNVFQKICCKFIDKGCKFCPIESFPELRGLEIAAKKYLDLE